MGSLRVSMGYELEVRGRSRKVEQRAFESLIEQAVLADKLGYEAVWMVEHHFTRGFSHSSAPERRLHATQDSLSRVAVCAQAFGDCNLAFGTGQDDVGEGPTHVHTERIAV